MSFIKLPSNSTWPIYKKDLHLGFSSTSKISYKLTTTVIFTTVIFINKID